MSNLANDYHDARVLADLGPDGMPFIVLGTFMGHRSPRGAADTLPEAIEIADRLHSEEEAAVYRHDGKTWKRTK